MHKARFAVGAVVLLGLALAVYLTLRPGAAGSQTHPTGPAATFSPTALATAVMASVTTTAPNVPVTVEPLALTREGRGWRLDIHDGYVRFGAGSGPTPWIGSAQLLLEWFSLPDSRLRKTYLLNVAEGTLAQVFGVDIGMSVFPNSAGQSSVLVINSAPAVRVLLSHLDARPGAVVYDTDPAVAQWSGPDAHVWDTGGATVFVSVTWINQDTFVLALNPDRSDSANIRDWGTKLLLVDVIGRQVRVLTGRGELAGVFPDGGLLWQEGWVNGGLRMLAPPYTGGPVEVVPGGPWTRDWAISPDGRRVAWLEIVPPPGDWSRRLPEGCCGGPDPDPVVQVAGVWERATGQVRHLSVAGASGSLRKDNILPEPAPATGLRIAKVSWSLSKDNILHWPGLRWRQDSSALLYAGQRPGDPGRISLFELALDGRSTVLAAHNASGMLGVLGEAQDRSLFYYVTGRDYYEGNAQLVRRYRDGTRKVLYEGGTMEWVASQTRLELLQQDALLLWDTSSGALSAASFPKGVLGGGQLGMAKIDSLVPVSPDGRWAAYAGTNSDAVIMGPDGIPDRGRVVQVVPFSEIPVAPTPPR